MARRFYLFVSFLAACAYPSETQESRFTVRPIRHSLPDGLQSVSGSSSDGGCTSRNGSICNLQDGGTSVLFDNTILPLSGLEGDQWARDLFTVRRSGTDDIVIGFDIGARVQLRRVELVLFNCPVQSIKASEIQIYGKFSTDPFPLSDPTSGGFLMGSRLVHYRSVNSCEDLLRICVQITSGGQFQVYYIVIPDRVESDWVYLAETIFHTAWGVLCNPDTLVTEPVTPPPEFMTTNTTPQPLTTLPATNNTESTTHQEPQVPQPSPHTTLATTTASTPSVLIHMQSALATTLVISILVVLLITSLAIICLLVIIMYWNHRRSRGSLDTEQRSGTANPIYDVPETDDHYEEVIIETPEKIELEANAAYGPVRH